MSLYPQPTLHNNTLNQVFNPADFNTSSKLTNNITGNLVVSGTGQFNNNLQVNGGCSISGNQTIGGFLTTTGIINASSNLLVNSSAYLQLPSGKQISSSNDVLDVTSIQTISGAKTFSTSLKTPMNTIISSSNDIVDTSNTQTISGAKTFSTSLKTPLNTIISSSNDVVDTSNTQTISGAKTFSTSLKTPLNTIISSSNDVVDTSNTQTISGAKTFSTISTFSAGISQPLPTAITTSATPSLNCLSYTYGTFTLTLSANVTGFTFSNMRAGGQYIIFITGGGSAFTISNTLTGTPAIKTNYGAAVSVPISGKAVLTAYYDGTNIFINSSAYA
jgi:hypothetical protein